MRRAISKAKAKRIL
jgi:catechol O-methyltransferase